MQKAKQQILKSMVYPMENSLNGSVKTWTMTNSFSNSGHPKVQTMAGYTAATILKAIEKNI